jgi:hypothetical protein
MIIAVVMSVLVMMLFSGPVSRFVNDHPTIQMLGLILPHIDRVFPDCRSSTFGSLHRFCGTQRLFVFRHFLLPFHRSTQYQDEKGQESQCNSTAMARPPKTAACSTKTYLDTEKQQE